MPTLPKETDVLLADFLLENNLVDAATYGEAAKAGKGIATQLLMQNKVTEDAIASKLSDFYSIKRTALQPAMLKERPLQDVLTVEFIQQSRILPLKLTGKTLSVALADPGALGNVNEVKMMSGCGVEPLVITLSELEKGIRALGSAMAAPAAPKPAGKATPHDRDDADEAPRRTVAEGGIASTGSDVIDFVNSLLAEAVLMGVSDIHMEMFRESARVRFRHHGVLQEMTDFNDVLTFNYSAIVTRIKIMASLDISERRLPQDGAVSFDTGNKMVDIRVSILPTAHGERVVMRILDPAAANFTLDELGLQDADLKSFRRAIHSPQGMLLVTGPTGSGKSTSMYAVLKELNQVGTNILTAEDPVEYDLFGVGQVQIREAIGLSFSAALRSFLRQDPEVIMVGEIRDKETSDIALKAALTGHLVLSTLHTNDAPSTITRLINMGIPNYLISAALILVVAQRLARVICQECKEADDTYNRDKLMVIGFSEEEAKSLTTYRGMGCDKCMGTGIKGRRAIHEILPISPQLKEAILNGASEAQMREIAKKNGFRSMQDTGRQLIRDGMLTVIEYQRILMVE